MDKIKIRDTRRKHYYTIDNMVYDNGEVNSQTLCLYNHLARHVHNDTGKCYIAIKSFCERWKIGKSTAYKSMELLEKLGYIITERKKGVPARITLLEVKAKVSSTEHQPVPERTPACPPQDINNTDKQDLINNTYKEQANKSAYNALRVKIIDVIDVTYKAQFKKTFNFKSAPNRGQIRNLTNLVLNDSNYDEFVFRWNNLVTANKESPKYAPLTPGQLYSNWERYIQSVEQPTFEITLDDLEKQGLRR